MNVSVVIPTLNRSDLLDQAVTAVRDTSDAELVVQLDEDRDGFAATCNRGAKEATGEVLVFLNDDTVVLDGWLDALLAPLSGPESAVIAGARLHYPDGGIQHTGVFLRRTPQGILEAYNRRTLAQSGPVPAVTGACLAIDREAWDRLGGFDESYRNGYEDVDLCLRAREAGGEVVYCAESAVIHFESQSAGRFDHASENIALLQERWGDLPL